MTKPNQLKPIEIGYGDDKVIFFPRLLSVAEEEEFSARFEDISDTDEEKWEKQFELCKEAIGEFSSEMPQRLVKEKGELKRVPLVEDAATIQEAVQKYYQERSIENERIIRDVWFLYKRQQAPSSRFL